MNEGSSLAANSRVNMTNPGNPWLRRMIVVTLVAVGVMVIYLSALRKSHDSNGNSFRSSDVHRELDGWLLEWEQIWNGKKPQSPREPKGRIIYQIDSCRASSAV